MKFGPIPVADAIGAVLAHATTSGERRYRKGQVLGADDVAALQAAGLAEVVVAALEPGDLGEDAAAEAIAAAMRHRHIEVKQAATGRVNLHATSPGVFTVDAQLIDAINAVDPAITVATLAQLARVERDQMVATVKIIPFAVSGQLVAEVIGPLRRQGDLRSQSICGQACRRNPDDAAEREIKRARQDRARHRTASCPLRQPADSRAPHAT